MWLELTTFCRGVTTLPGSQTPKTKHICSIVFSIKIHKPWSSVARGDECSYKPNSETNLDMILHSLSLLCSKFINATAIHLGQFEPHLHAKTVQIVQTSGSWMVPGSNPALGKNHFRVIFVSVLFLNGPHQLFHLFLVFSINSTE